MQRQWPSFWGIGAIISILVVAGNVLTTHTALALWFFWLYMPVSLATDVVLQALPHSLSLNNFIYYGLSVLFGSVFYGTVAYLIWRIVSRVLRRIR
jgi:hypothetical protein